MDRKTLFEDVAFDLNRMDKARFMPSWLRSAEMRINQILRVGDMVKRGLLEVTERNFAAPPDFLAIESFSVQGGTSPLAIGNAAGALLYAPAADVDSDVSGQYRTLKPRYFTRRGNFFELMRWNSGEAFQLQLYYFASLPPLTKDESTSWLLEKAPHIYKNAMLHFGFLHLEESGTAADYMAMVANEIAGMNEVYTAEKTSAGPLIPRPVPRSGWRHS